MSWEFVSLPLTGCDSHFGDGGMQPAAEGCVQFVSCERIYRGMQRENAVQERVASQQRGAAESDDFQAVARSAFTRMISEEGYPCLGAKAALHADSLKLLVYGEMAAEQSTAELAQDLGQFVRELHPTEDTYASFVAVFRRPRILAEQDFEQKLWRQLDRLNQIDSRNFAWDPNVSSDPADPRFSFSFAGRALYVIGLHAQSARMARQFPWPALVFNPHEQFERLRAEGNWKRMQRSIRQRDVALQGSINPMLSDFGENSEARQYAGRAVEDGWQPAFEPRQADADSPSHPPGRCPFHH